MKDSRPHLGEVDWHVEIVILEVAVLFVEAKPLAKQILDPTDLRFDGIGHPTTSEAQVSKVTKSTHLGEVYRHVEVMVQEVAVLLRVQ